MKISVVIATYNGEKYIEEQLESVVTQTRRPDEIILVDDASKDASIDVAENILALSMIPYVIIRHAGNKGVNATFEEGIQAAEGDYIMICDQDDKWDPEKIQCTEEIIEQFDSPAMVVCNAEITDADLIPTGETMFDYIRFPGVFADGLCILSSDRAQELLLHRNYVTGMCMAVKREIAISAIPFSSHMTYDSHLAWVAALNGTVVFNLKPLVLYRQHGRNVIGTQKKKIKLIPYLKERKSVKEGFRDKYQDLYDATPEDKKIRPKIKEARDFYQHRADLKKHGVKWIADNRDLYQKYTGNAKIEAAKDLMEMVLVR